jgi:hypothetical protein
MLCDAPAIDQQLETVCVTVVGATVSATEMM